MAFRTSTARLVKLGGSLSTPAQRSSSTTKAKDLFHEVARTLPWVLSNYKLEEITTVRELRGNVARLFKLHSHMKNEGAIDVMIFKGREELEMVLLQHKQRHHLIADYITKVDTMKRQQSTESPFLSLFYAGNQPLPYSQSGQTTKGL